MEMPIGSFAKYPLTLICYAAAAKLLEHAGELLSLTLDPEGRVYLEPPEEAAEVDVVGTYRIEKTARRRDVEDILREDLQHERELRKLI